MKAKRIFTGLSALTLAGLMSITAFASEAPDRTEIKPDTSGNPDPNPASTTVTYSVDPGYIVTIPTAVKLSDKNNVNDAVSASEVRLLKGSKIVVSLDESNDFKLFNGDASITYQVSNTAGKLVEGDTVKEFTADDSETLTFAQIDKEAVQYAGDYTGSLVFDIAVEEPSAPSLADAFKNGSVTAVNVNNKNGGTNTFGFTYENGTFTSISPDGNNGYTSNFANNVKLTKENNYLVLKTTAIEDGSFSMTPQFVRTYTFDTSNNTYTYTPPTDVNNSIENCRTFNSISVNGTEIPVTLES